MTQIRIDLPDMANAQLAPLAKELGLSKAELIPFLVQDWLNNPNPVFMGKLRNAYAEAQEAQKRAFELALA